MGVINNFRVFSFRSYGITGLAETGGAVGQGKLTQEFGQQRIADRAAVGRESLCGTEPLPVLSKTCRPHTQAGRSYSALGFSASTGG